MTETSEQHKHAVWMDDGIQFAGAKAQNKSLVNGGRNLFNEPIGEPRLMMAEPSGSTGKMANGLFMVGGIGDIVCGVGLPNIFFISRRCKSA